MASYKMSYLTPVFPLFQETFINIFDLHLNQQNPSSGILVFVPVFCRKTNHCTCVILLTRVITVVFLVTVV